MMCQIAREWIPQLLDELTELRRLDDADEADPNRHMIDLVQLVKRMADESHAAARVGSHVVVFSAVPNLVGRWHRAHLERMLANLIDNALKYNRQDRPVVVSIQHLDGWAIISVTDQGVGIPPEELQRVFERGYRAGGARCRAHRRGNRPRYRSGCHRPGSIG